MYMSSTTSNLTKAQALAQVQALIAGTQKHLPTGSFTIGSTTYTAAALIQVLQSLVDAMTKRNAAVTGAKDAAAAEQVTETQVGPILQAYRRLVLAAYANATQTLSDFGLVPPKARTPMTTEQKAAAAAKAKATRTARGTTSKKAKLKVTGNVTGNPRPYGGPSYARVRHLTEARSPVMVFARSPKWKGTPPDGSPGAHHRERAS
jgi:hypothetical protein